MVARMMRWRPWPPISSKKMEVRLVLKRMEGFECDADDVEEEAGGGFMAEVRWKGPKLTLRRKVKRNCTRKEKGILMNEGGMMVVEWNEEFESLCTFTSHKENAFHPWDLEIRVFNGLKQELKNKASVIGMTSMNLAEFASTVGEEIEINLPLLVPGVYECHPSLVVALSLLELRTLESSETVQRSIVPHPLSPTSGDSLPSEKDEHSALKVGFRKVNFFKEFVSTRKTKKTCRQDEGSEERCSPSPRSEDADYLYPFDTDSLDDDLDEGELEDGKEGSNIRKSCSYGTLATANYVGGSLYLDAQMNRESEDWVYYSHRRSDVGCSNTEETISSVPDPTTLWISKRSILPWKKRKLGFRSPKAKGEPLLKKGNGEEGGDDIDYDRRQLSSSDESLALVRLKVNEDLVANKTSLSDFGDDNFAIGSWESKEVVSRDGQLKLSTQVFFASIDQRSESASGESACTALVAVIANWFQSNNDTMPIKSQFDSLIRDGSFEWRELCKKEIYREKFPDKHFDLDTVLQAKIRHLSVVPGKSFIGFFNPEGMESHTGFDFLNCAMSFDCIWDEISQSGSSLAVNGSPQIYIVSWNDHFFVLKVERDAYYIIDTLGERFYEGCDQAYILKFDENTSIHRILSEENKPDSESKEEEMVCRGKESCKEYIKSFLAAIPIRELHADIKKGLMASNPLHHRLQIEFHYTELVKEKVSTELVVSPQFEDFFLHREDQGIEALPMSPSEEEFDKQVVLFAEETKISSNDEYTDEFLLRREEPVIGMFNLTSAVEVA